MSPQAGGLFHVTQDLGIDIPHREILPSFSGLCVLPALGTPVADPPLHLSPGKALPRQLGKGVPWVTGGPAGSKWGPTGGRGSPRQPGTGKPAGEL